MTYVKRTKRAKPDPELVKLADSLLDQLQETLSFPRNLVFHR
jgi:hypothetical protein